MILIILAALVLLTGCQTAPNDMTTEELKQMCFNGDIHQDIRQPYCDRYEFVKKTESE